MTNGIHIKFNGDGFLVSGGRGFYTTKYIPDLVGCAAYGLRHYGRVHGDETMDPFVHAKVVESAIRLSTRGNYKSPLFVGSRQKTGKPSQMVLMEASYGKKTVDHPEVFDDKEKFKQRVNEIVVQKGVSIVLNTGIQDRDMPLQEDVYNELVRSAGLECKESEEVAA